MNFDAQRIEMSKKLLQLRTAMAAPLKQGFADDEQLNELKAQINEVIEAANALNCSSINAVHNCNDLSHISLEPIG